jgi:hypothetical protein
MSRILPLSPGGLGQRSASGHIILNTQPAAFAFIAEWIDCNVRPHDFGSDIALAVTDHVERCIAAAATRGITASDIEVETGCHPAELVAAAYLARWTPAVGYGGSA